MDCNCNSQIGCCKCSPMAPTKLICKYYLHNTHTHTRKHSLRQIEVAGRHTLHMPQNGLNHYAAANVLAKMAIKFIPNSGFSHSDVRAVRILRTRSRHNLRSLSCANREKKKQQTNTRKKRRQLTRPIYFHFIRAPRYANRIRILIWL